MAIRARTMKKLSGAGTVFDFRGTGLLPPNGGRIPLLIMVEHIPVFPNKKGIEDFIGLAGVLRAQGLSLQAATDSEGNVAIYNNLNTLCFQAKGANSISCGVEHMHMTIAEPWTRAQLNASAWLWHYAHVVYGLPKQRAWLGHGNGLVTVKRKGHTGHRDVSHKAGFNDRSDPGPRYDWGYVNHAADFFARKRTFKGA
jgi:hypothetical protein